MSDEEIDYAPISHGADYWKRNPPDVGAMGDQQLDEIQISAFNGEPQRILVVKVGVVTASQEQLGEAEKARFDRDT
jgi:hypothetical protein